MSAKTGQSVAVLFVTNNPAIGSAVNADATPTGTLYLNGVVNAAVVTVTNLATGLYKASVTMPTLAAGGRLSLSVAATVGGVTGKGIIWGDMGETATASDVKTVADGIAAKTANLPTSPAAVGSAMTLTATYDDKLDAVKLKTDTIGGAGAIEWPYTLTVNGMPCADVAVWVTSDEAGNNVVASGRTDDFGALVPVPNLDAGTYYFWAKKSGVNFSSPDIEVVV